MNASMTPHSNEYTPEMPMDIDPGLLAANVVMPFQQEETLAYDSSLSPEAQQQKEQRLFQAVGQVSIASAGLDYEELKLQAEATYFAQVNAHVQQQAAESVAKATTETEDEDEEDVPSFRKSPFALAA